MVGHDSFVTARTPFSHVCPGIFRTAWLREGPERKQVRPARGSLRFRIVSELLRSPAGLGEDEHLRFLAGPVPGAL